MYVNKQCLFFATNMTKCYDSEVDKSSMTLALITFEFLLHFSKGIGGLKTPNLLFPSVRQIFYDALKTRHQLRY